MTWLRFVPALREESMRITPNCLEQSSRLTAHLQHIVRLSTLLLSNGLDHYHLPGVRSAILVTFCGTSVDKLRGDGTNRLQERKATAITIHEKRTVLCLLEARLGASQPDKLG